jgi:EmrB/QacA subfamily drug resistance transporter
MTNQNNKFEHYRIVPLVVACPLFLQNLDTSVMATALPSIASSLQVQVLHLNLAITAYLLSLAVFLPVSGWLSERFGPKRVFCGAIIFFSLGSALCGAAQSLPQLVLFRVLQGIGGAMMVPVGRLILLRSVPPERMVSAMVWFTVPGAIGRMAGPLFGGAIVTLVSWRWIFLVNIPFGLLGVLMAMRYVDGSVPEPEGQAPFDLRGFVLLAAGLTGVLGALETAGRALVPAAVSWAMAIAGLLALWTYYRHSRRRTEPLIDIAILRYPTYRAAVLGGMPLRIAIGASPFLLPLMLQLGFGLSPLKSGLLTVATAIGSLSTRAVMVRMIRAVGFRSLLLGATFMTSLFYASYGLFRPSTPHVLMFGVMLLGGLCNSMAMVTLNTLGYSEIPRPRMSHATALSSMAQQLSLSLGVVMGASLLTLTSLLRGGDAAHLQAGDFSPAFVAIGTMTMLSVLAFSRLRKEEGEELRAR